MRRKESNCMENNTNKNVHEKMALYIPVNIRTRFEFFDGFGFAELIPTLIIAAVSGIIAFIVHLIAGGMITPMLIVLVTTAAAVMCLAKGANNISVVDQIRYIIRFSREQQVYKYRYGDEWRNSR